MVQPKHEQRVAIIENALVNGLLVSCLINALKNRNRMSGGFASDLLKAQGRAMK